MTFRKIAAALRDGDHVYVFRPGGRRKPRVPVWLGYKEHIEALDTEEVLMLVAYRMAFDARCCGSVN